MFIRTERLLLRPSWPDDLDEFVELLNDEPVARNLGTKELPDTVEKARSIIAMPRNPRYPHFFINLRSDEGLKLIGGIGLGPSGDDAELGYWIGRSYWGHGYASEAVEAVLRQAWILGHPRIIAMHYTDNEATARVLQKAGFQASGETVMRYSYVRGYEAPASVFVAERPAMPGLEPEVNPEPVQIAPQAS